MKDTLKRIYPIYAAYTGADKIAWALGMLYLYSQGFSFQELLFYSIIAFAIFPIYVLFQNTLHTKKMFNLFPIIRILSFITVFRFYHKFQLWIFAILAGLALVYFWVPFNMRYFTLVHNKKKAYMSAIYLAVGPISSVIIPGLAGFIAAGLTFQANLIIGSVLMLVPYLFIRKIDEKIIKYDIKKLIKKHKGVRTLIVLEGLYVTIPYSLIALFTLYFIESELKYGLFFSYLGLVGFFASLVMTKLSDRIRKRTIFITPLVFCASSSLVLLGLAKDLVWWSIATGLTGFFLVLLEPFMITLTMDLKHYTKELFISREIFLAIGRVICISLFVVSLYLFQTPKYAFILVALIFLAVPLVIKYKKLYQN